MRHLLAIARSTGALLGSGWLWLALYPVLSCDLGGWASRWGPRAGEGAGS